MLLRLYMLCGSCESYRQIFSSKLMNVIFLCRSFALSSACVRVCVFSGIFFSIASLHILKRFIRHA